MTQAGNRIIWRFLENFQEKNSSLPRLAPRQTVSERAGKQLLTGKKTAFFQPHRGQEERRPCHCRSVLPGGALVTCLAAGGFAVLNGLGRAAAEAGHAVGAVVAPDRPAVLHMDVAKRADLLAFAAGDAGIGHGKAFGLHVEPVEQGVDHAGFELVGKACGMLGCILPGQDAVGTGPDGGGSGSQKLLCFLLCGRREEDNIVVRHYNGEGAAAGQGFFRTKGAVGGGGISYLTAAGHDEIGIPAAGKMCAANKVGKDAGNLPAVGGADKDPRFAGGKLSRDSVADIVKGVHTFVLQGFSQQAGAVAAVAGSGKVKDHKKRPP